MWTSARKKAFVSRLQQGKCAVYATHVFFLLDFYYPQESLQGTIVAERLQMEAKQMSGYRLTARTALEVQDIADGALRLLESHIRFLANASSVKVLLNL